MCSGPFLISLSAKGTSEQDHRAKMEGDCETLMVSPFSPSVAQLQPRPKLVP